MWAQETIKVRFCYFERTIYSVMMTIRHSNMWDLNSLRNDAFTRYCNQANFCHPSSPPTENHLNAIHHWHVTYLREIIRCLHARGAEWEHASRAAEGPHCRQDWFVSITWGYILVA